MREASTKPSAATVLPAPVACSNQKRLAALGSSGCSSSWASSSSPASGLQSCGSSGSSSSSSSSLLAGDADGGERDDVLGGDRAVAVAVAVALGLGEQRGQRARERVDLVGGEHGAVDELRLLLAEQPLEAEQQRERAPPLDRGHLEPGVELRQRRVERHAPRAARRERGRGVLALVEEGLARELRGPLEVRGSRVRAWRDRPLTWIQPRKGETFGEETAAAVGCERPVETLASSTSSRESLRLRPLESAARECVH